MDKSEPCLVSVASQIELQVGESFSCSIRLTGGHFVCWVTLIVGGHDHFHRYHCCQGEEEQQYEDPPVQLLVVSIPELVRLWGGVISVCW